MEYELIDNKNKKQYEFHIDESIARVEYIKLEDQKKIYLTHTEVPKSLEGKGISSQLVKAVFKALENEGLALIPLCPFVAMYIKKHPEWKYLVADGINIE